MPLSRVKQAKWMRKYRAKQRLLGITANIAPQKVKPVIPKPIIDAISPSIRREGYGKASSTVIPEQPSDTEDYTGRVAVPSMASNCVSVDADGNIIPDVT